LLIKEKRSKLERKALSGVMLTLLLICILTLAFNIQPVKAEPGTIYIRADGSIDPPTANITSADNVTYTFTDNINDSIVVERNDIIINGTNHTLQGADNGTGIDLSGRLNVTVKNIEIKSFAQGIYLNESSNNLIIENDVTNNQYGIYLENSSGNTIFHNNFKNNTQQVFIYTLGNANVWDDGYPSGGNYWSDYNGTDFYNGPYQNETGSDGIGDTPYVMDANNTDRYPLIYPYGFVPCPDVNGDGRVDILDAIKASIAFGSCPGHRRWNYSVDQKKDSAINIFDLIIIARNIGKTYP